MNQPAEASTRPLQTLMTPARHQHQDLDMVIEGSVEARVDTYHQQSAGRSRRCRIIYGNAREVD